MHGGIRLKWIRNKVGLLLSLTVFAFMLIWFTHVHPFVLLTGDDWLYIAKPRAAIPWISAWNPSRILPEILMPACGNIAVFVLYPIVKDYVFSFTLVFAITASLFVALYIYAFYRFIRCKIQTTNAVSGLVAVAFFLTHFLVMRSSVAGNKYLFGNTSPTNLYYYIIPTLLNGTLVFYFEMIEAEDRSIALDCSVRTGLMLIVLFLAIFSNMYSSVVLAVYAGVKLLCIVLKRIANGSKLSRHLYKGTARYLIVLGMWLVSIVMEFFGGRSRAIRGQNGSFRLAKTAMAFIQTATAVKKSFVLASVLLLLAIVILLRIRRKKCADNVDRNIAATLLAMLPCGILTAMYMVLLSAIVAPSYIRTSKVWIAILFFFLSAIVTGCAYIVKRFPKLAVALPLMVLILGTMIDTPDMTFGDGTYANLDASVCMAIDNYMIDAIIRADAEGKTEVTVDVPVNQDRDDNWPLPAYMGNRLSYVTYLHRLTSRRIEVTFRPDPEVNKRFSLNEHMEH